jgi:hypothetical protein
MSQLDLNQLRKTLIKNAQRGDARPAESWRMVVVDRNGKIRRADEVNLSKRRELSVVPQEVFAGIREFVLNSDTPELSDFGGDRLARDRDVVREKLPDGTREITVEGTTGWVYKINDEFNEPYAMMAYFDGSEYQVKVLEPAIEGHYGVTDAHIFSDGRLCLRPPAGGMPTLAEAYAKSVLWANGFTICRRAGHFPWPRH